VLTRRDLRVGQVRLLHHPPLLLARSHVGGMLSAWHPDPARAAGI